MSALARFVWLTDCSPCFAVPVSGYGGIDQFFVVLILWGEVQFCAYRCRFTSCVKN